MGILYTIAFLGRRHGAYLTDPLTGMEELPGACGRFFAPERVLAAFRKMLLTAPGARIIKTALAVAISIWITSRLVGDNYIPFAGISAVLAIQPTWEEVRKTTWSQVAASFIGTIWGIAAALVFAKNPLWIGLNVYLMFSLGKWLHFEKIAALSVTIMLLTMVQSDQAGYAIHRVTGAIIGLAVGAAINFLLWRPKDGPESSAEPEAESDSQ